jgi:hypothetical protein
METIGDCLVQRMRSASLSIVIPVRDRWDQVALLLDSIRRQCDPPSYDVTVVDDGSSRSPPVHVDQVFRDMGVRCCRQLPQGVSAARNHGVRATSGETIFFVDSDCELDEHCLAELALAIRLRPGSAAFQARIVGVDDSLVGKTEAIRLSATQWSLLSPDGHIRWIDTAGFALRRSAIRGDGDLFDVRATRAQDTLLLAHLLRGGEIPFFARGAMVRHVVTLRPGQYIWKSFKGGGHASAALAQIRAEGVDLRMSTYRRVRAFCMAVRLALQSRYGLFPVLVLLLWRAAKCIGGWRVRQVRDSAEIEMAPRECGAMHRMAVAQWAPAVENQWDTPRSRILAVASGGGHWVELLRLVPAFDGQDVFFVTVSARYKSDADGRPFFVVPDATRWNKLGLLLLAMRVACILVRVRPHVVISTGAAPGYFALRLGKALGAKTIWIDSLANAGEVSLAGRLSGRCADLWLTQWSHLACPEGPHFGGAVL